MEVWQDFPRSCRDVAGTTATSGAALLKCDCRQSHLRSPGMWGNRAKQPVWLNRALSPGPPKSFFCNHDVWCVREVGKSCFEISIISSTLVSRLPESEVTFWLPYMLASSAMPRACQCWTLVLSPCLLYASCSPNVKKKKKKSFFTPPGGLLRLILVSSRPPLLQR